jgi:hypothetical protein
MKEASSQTLRDKNMALLGAMTEIFALGRPWVKQTRCKKPIPR